MLDSAGPHDGIHEWIDHIRAKLAGITDRHRDRLNNAEQRLVIIEGCLTCDEAVLQHLQTRINRLEDWRANETEEAS